jgi:hypothetical protein
VHAESEVSVNCVYPGELLGKALGDFATQLGYSFEPAEDSEVDLEEPIWVLARGVSPSTAVDLIQASGGVYVRVDHDARRVEVFEEPPEGAQESRVVAYDVSKQVDAYVEYLERFGEPAEEGTSGALTGTEQLQSVVEEVLSAESMQHQPGSPVGKKLVYTCPVEHHELTGELLDLIGSTSGGESATLKQDRKLRAKLAAMKSDMQHESATLSAMLWQLFKDFDAPVYLDRSLMDWIDIEDDLTSVTLSTSRNHHQDLLALAREQEFSVDSRHGALRLHMLDWEGSAAYRVYDVHALLVELEKDYAEMKTKGDVRDGYSGDLRSEGGVDVIANALEQQIENAAYSPMILTYGAKVIVVGGVEEIDLATDVLVALGWTNESEGK